MDHDGKHLVGDLGKRVTPVVLLGDSLTQLTGVPATDWASYARNATTDDTIRFIGKGVGGEQAAAIALRVAADVVAVPPKFCIAFAGANDVGNATTTTLATTTTALTSIYNQLQAAGIPFIACTVAPRNAGSGGNTAGIVAARVGEVNEWIRSNLASWPDAMLCDWAYPLSDGGDGVTPTAAYIADTVHWTEAGSRVAGTALGPVLSSMLAIA